MRASLPASGSVSAKTANADPRPRRGSQAARWASLPQRLSDTATMLCTVTMLRTEAHPRPNASDSKA